MNGREKRMRKGNWKKSKRGKAYTGMVIHGTIKLAGR